MAPPDLAAIGNEAVRLAERLRRRSVELTTPTDERQNARLARTLAHPEGVAFLARLLDRAARPRDPHRLIELVVPLLGSRPRVLGSAAEVLLDMWARLAPLAPALAVPTFLAGLRHELHRYVIRGEVGAIARYVRHRHDHHVRVNLNWAGEAVLSDAEAEAWLARCERALAWPFVEALSVKVSALCPRPHPLAAEALVPQVVSALTRLFRAAGPAKLVSLDMESFADLELTVTAFRAALEQPSFLDRTHGLALQAYVADSSEVQRELIGWAKTRVAAGGAPIRIRLVKGANLGAERFEARLRGLAPPTLASKGATDAHFKRMVATALEPDNARAVRVGVASHNLFDVAFALTLARERGTLDRLTIEMLHGMAEPLLRAVAEEAPDALVYAPAAPDAEILSAVAYLLRRLDENAAPQHFLHHAFTMRVGDSSWHDEEARFRDSLHDAAAATSPVEAASAGSTDAAFRNSPETDWTRAPTRAELVAALRDRAERGALTPAQLSAADVDGAVERAAADPSGWATRSLAERRQALLRGAALLHERRFTLAAAMAHQPSKTPAESDPEIAEAIDYAAYYAHALDTHAADSRLGLAPRGAVAVIAPWNFPLAIPLGGALAALIGGNRVLLKPSPLAEEVALLGSQALWDAGVPRDALQLVTCDVEVAARLVTHPLLGALVFTGSTATARRLIEARPELPIFAETGGKNAIVVTAAADRERAIADIVRGSFSHGGQKCSAASLIVAEAEVFDDPSFERRLVEAAATLRLGAATDLATELGPLAAEPGPALVAMLRELPAHERWALRPRLVGPRQLSPGIVWNVQEGSPSHREELFGPVACVMRARDLDDAIRLVNASGYGLTSALESLDEREWRRWIEHLEAGNLYVDRPLVGAIVDRQPFGGWGLSSFGPGAKTGGPNYAAQLMRVTGRVSEATRYDARPLPTVRHTQRIPGQLNLFRYRPCPDVVIRVEEDDDPQVVRLRHDAARAAGASPETSDGAREPLDALTARLPSITRVVMCREDAPRALLAAAARSWTWVCREPLTGTERDLLPFVREQSISIDTQRHGWIGPQADAFLP